MVLRKWWPHQQAGLCSHGCGGQGHVKTLGVKTGADKSQGRDFDSAPVTRSEQRKQDSPSTGNVRQLNENSNFILSSEGALH